MTMYRPEVDGLRALAVVPVILFHAGFAAFAGGFVGVDVFFVISGYLIASIIVEEMRGGTFSFATFFERRARRIIPALYAVLLVTLPLGWLFMLPDNFENLGQSVVATVGVSNNVLLWLTSGYWDLSNEFKPLLHTWSLGVEEQFYFVFPLVLLALVPRGKRVTLWVFAIAALASLVAAQWFVMSKPLAAFFLLPMRAWELLIGAMFAVTCSSARPHALQLGRVGAALALLGLALILAPVFLYDSTTPFPGIAALPPTVGTLLVIMFASPSNLVGRLLSWRVLVAIGLGSYSAYLWHQPLFAFIRLLSPEHPRMGVWLAALAATAVLAYLSWRFIEQPFRSRARFSRQWIFTMTVLMGGCLGVAGTIIDQLGGIPSRVPSTGGAMDGGGRQARHAYIDRAYAFQTEAFADDGRERVLVVGNSYARDFLNMVLENGYMGQCELSYEPIPDPAQFSCRRNLDSLSPSLRRRLTTCDVLILVMPALDEQCLAGDLEWLRREVTAKVIVLGTKNFGRNPNCIMAMTTSEAAGYRARIAPEVWDANERHRNIVGPGSFVDVIEMIADNDRRAALMTSEGLLVSEDGGHLTRAGARALGRLVFEHPLLAPYRN